MRVLYVTMAFPTPYETFAGTDVRALRRAGVDVSVCSLRPPHPDAAALVPRWGLRGVAVSHNGVGASLRGLRYALRHPARFAMLLAWLVRWSWRTPRFLVRALVLAPRCLDILDAVDRTTPDVVHLFWGHYPAAVGFLVRRYHPRVVLSVFLGAYDLEWNVGVSGPVARAADVVWTHSASNVAAIAALGVRQQRIAVAHRGIELGRFAHRQPHKVPGRIVTAGRLHPDKGMGHVIEAFAAIMRRHPEVTLVVVGDGADRARLEALATSLGIAQAVSFLGRVSHEQVLAQMAEAELFLYLSTDRTDRLPNVVKEAVASGCLCVISRTTGIEELIRDGVDGWVVDRGDVGAAVDRACVALADQPRSAAMTAAAREHLIAEFDVDRSMARYAERWRELLAPARAEDRRAPRPPFAPAGDRHSEASALSM